MYSSISLYSTGTSAPSGFKLISVPSASGVDQKYAPIASKVS